jgi:putative transposase
MQSVEKHSALLSIVALCAALGVARASFYRHQRRLESPPPSRRRPGPPRALNQGAREEVLALLRSPRFVDRSPAEMQHTLVEEDGRYLCSESTMYRILHDNAEVRDRRNQLRHPSYAKPELLATAPNQVWSWDITKLKGPSKWNYYYLFAMLDIFSRYAVAWMVAEHENAELAKRLIRDAYDKQGVEPGTLVVHNDRGSPMKAKTTGQLVASLGVEQSFSRPHVSNDNPFSESHFKTCKYHPGFPERFGSITDALQYCRTFFPWYNDEHRHSSLVYLTPKQVHYGSAQAALDKRHEVMLAAYREHPQRFVNGPPKPAALPTEVWINPPTAPEKQDADAGVPITPTGADAATGVETASDGSSPLHPSDKSLGVRGTESPDTTPGEAGPSEVSPSEPSEASSDGDQLPRLQGAQVASQQSPILPAGAKPNSRPSLVRQGEKQPVGGTEQSTEIDRH